MTPTEVLKMLKSKIDAAELNKCNYAIETSDIEAINQALLLYDVVRRSELFTLEQMRQAFDAGAWEHHLHTFDSWLKTLK